MKHYKRTVLSALLALALLTTAAVAAGGSKSDPLVTLSYLEDTVLDDILEQVTKTTKKVRTELEKDCAQQIEDYQAEAEELRAKLRAIQDALCGLVFPEEVA